VGIGFFVACIIEVSCIHVDFVLIRVSVRAGGVLNCSRNGVLDGWRGNDRRLLIVPAEQLVCFFFAV
jgi:hypothetical protein